mmetsp:Transcript_51551/g.120208  ORF Transcript_51551/g.120208 Transcript_51551/m.120208 type:complete len:96 (+) Transcript_51551:340-627(+)
MDLLSADADGDDRNDDTSCKAGVRDSVKQGDGPGCSVGQVVDICSELAARFTEEPFAGKSSTCPRKGCMKQERAPSNDGRLLSMPSLAVLSTQFL